MTSLPISLSNAPARRRVRVCYFNTWAGAREEAASYVARASQIDISALVTNRNDAALLKKARLDCDWYAENARCFAALQHPRIEFLPAWVCGPKAIVELGQAPREPGEERWFLTMGQQPQALGAIAGKAFALLAKIGIRHLYYAFDEASRAMPCFNDIAPYLDGLIHDESPLAEKGRASLKPSGVNLHRSWVANVVPFSVPFNETPEDKIMFLGSKLGLTPHRQRQIDFLTKKFKDRFVPSVDHRLSVADRSGLNRFKVGLCPEGRMFTTPAMAQTHTDRPFWLGCMGLVPVAEDSKSGGRLQELHERDLIVRYPHANLSALGEACERALAMPNETRRRIYQHFNQHETVGTVVADAIAAAAPGGQSGG